MTTVGRWRACSAAEADAQTWFPSPRAARCPPVLEDRLVQISILIGQVPVTWDVNANLGTLRDIVDEAQPGDLVVLPEGMLSGYGEDLTPLELSTVP